MSDEFVQGLRIETKKSQYGEFMKCSIDTEQIFNNPVNRERWINFNIFKSKAGNWYAKISKPQGQESATQKPQAQDNVVEFAEISEDEIPF